MSKNTNFMPYDEMVKYTPQEVWIKGKGVFLWLAFFFSEAGAGLYFVSLILGLRQGMILGWLLTLVLGGGLHVLYLGKPFRILYMFLKPGKSELSRGLWVILFFTVLGFFQISAGFSSPVMNVIMGLICLLIITHGFLTMSVVKALPVWNSSMMVPLAVASGLWVGSQIAVVICDLAGQPGQAVELWARWSLFGFIVFFGLFIFGAYHGSTSARVSIKLLLSGEWSKPFYIGVILIGIVLPMIITLVIWQGGSESGSSFTLVFRCICIIIGDLSMRYGVMKNAMYSPLI